MNGLIVGTLGIYILMTGFKGNSKKLLDYLQADAPGFFPWAVVIAVLAVASENENTAKIAKPFIGLAILTFILSNFDRLRAEYAQIRDMALNASNKVFAPESQPANNDPNDPASQIPTGGDGTVAPTLH